MTETRLPGEPLDADSLAWFDLVQADEILVALVLHQLNYDFIHVLYGRVSNLLRIGLKSNSIFQNPSAGIRISSKNAHNRLFRWKKE